MAITLQDVQNTFKDIIELSPIDGETEVIPFSSGFVPVQTFSTLFANSVDLSSVSLDAIDSKNGYGYSTVIDEWKSKGLIL